MRHQNHPVRSALITLITLTLGSAGVGMVAGFLYGIGSRAFKAAEGLWGWL